MVDRFVAEGGSFGSDAKPALFGAFLTEAQKERLSRAFQARPRLTEADLDLFAVIRPWAADAAVAALVRKFQAAEPPEDGLDRQVMDLLATELDDGELKVLVEEANAEIEGYWSAMPEEPTEEDEKLFEKKSAATEKELRRRFVTGAGREAVSSTAPVGADFEPPKGSPAYSPGREPRVRDRRDF